MTDRQAKAKSLEILKRWGPFFPSRFGTWIFPIIRNMPPFSVADLITAAEPMRDPPDFSELTESMRTPLFYLDFCYTSDTWYKRLWDHVRWFFRKFRFPW